MTARGEQHTRWDGTARRLAIALVAVIAVILLAPEPAGAAKYSVAQCGWRAGNSGDWGDTTGGAKFRGESFCAVPEPAGSFDGANAKSLTREGAGTVAGTRFARWRWTAPPGTGITAVHGQWWHALREGFQHRVGTVGGSGFDAFATATETRTWPDHFAAGFAAPRHAFESRLLCARPESSSCALAPGSWSALRTLTLTLVDTPTPRAAIDGPLLAAGWRRGEAALRFTDSDVGAGLLAASTRIDGKDHATSSFDCAHVNVAGEVRAARMQPCPERRAAFITVDTRRLPDGVHTAGHCALDFAGNVGCAEPVRFRVDNHSPAPPLALSAGGEAWRSGSHFNVTWRNPDQEPGSEIAGATYRLTGDGYDSGAVHVAGGGRSAISAIPVPRPGTYTVRVWLRDVAGNESPESVASAVVRLDDRAPGLEFEEMRGKRPQVVRVSMHDADSGAGPGTISYRRAGSAAWHPMPTTLTGRVGQTEPTTLTARFPAEQLAPGRYELQAEASDVAGNRQTTSRRADGGPMRLTAPLRRPTVLRAWLAAGGERGRRIRTAFGARARVAGRLTRPSGRPLGGRLLRVTVRPAPGARGGVTTRTVPSGGGGRFSLRLERGASRRVEVRYAGNARLASSGAGVLHLAVSAGVTLRATPKSLRTGERLVLSGRVRGGGATAGAAGRRVDIQFLDSDAGRWRPVLSTRTGRGGAFYAGYRFRFISGAARIRLRAKVAGESGWPFAPGISAPVVVHVTG